MPEGVRVGSLYAEIGLKKDKFDAGLSSARQDLGKAAQEFSKQGRTFSSLSDAVNKYAGTLKDASPQNLIFAQKFDYIKTSFEKGTYSISKARLEIEKLQKEMRAASITPFNFEKAAQDFTKQGRSFSSLRDEVNKYAGSLKEATPQNVLFAQKFDFVKQKFEAGEYTIRKARFEINKLQNEMRAATPLSERLSGAIKGAAKSMALVGGAAVAVGYAAKQIYDLGRAGAELEFTKDKFDRLTESIGTTGDALLIDLRRATKGIYSDAQLMQSATDFMALGFAKTREEAVRLATVAGGLNMNMNQLVLTLANKTTMRFDQLGVKVEGFEGKLNKLKAAGMDVDAAFQEAFLQQAEEQLIKVGNAADTALGNFMRLEAQTQNLTDATKEYIGVALTPTVGALATAMEAQNKLRDAVEDGIISDKERTRILRQVSAMHMTNAQAIEFVEKRMKIFGVTTEGTRDGLIQWSDNLKIAGVRLQSLGQSTGGTTAEILKYQMAQYDAVQATTLLTREIYNAEEAMGRLDTLVNGRLGPSLEDFNEKQDNLQIKISQVQAKIDFLNGKQYLTDKQREELNDLTGEMLELKEQYTENADEHDEATKRIMFNLLQQQAAVDGLSKAEVEALTNISIQWGLIDQATANYVAAASAGFEELAAGLIEPSELLDYITARLNEMDGRVINTTVITEYIEKGSVRTGEQRFGGEVTEEMRQHGGPVFAGQPYMVGERGPEMFVPGQSGQVISNDRMERALGNLRPINIYITGGASRDNARYLAEQVGAELQRQARYS